MENLIKIAKEYVQDKRNAWNNKNSHDLCYENPFILELKLTGLHLKDLYSIVKGKRKINEKKGLWAA
ncbi:unnamed protein product, partial [marine sediment metagenome]